MELPQPPQDEDLRNIIDKLAIFVARNGVEFETMTKQKQRENPRFAFLFGGEFYNYYMYRVTTEQAVLRHRTMRQQQQQQQQQQQPNQMGGPNPNFQHFGGGPPRMPQQQPSGQNPFDLPQNFDRPQQQQMQQPFENQGMLNFQPRGGPGLGPRPGAPGPRFENRNFNDDRPNFQRPSGGNFDMGNAAGNFDPGMQGTNFERNFDQRQQPGGGPRPGVFEQRMLGPTNFEPRSGNSFENRPPGPGNFEPRQPCANFIAPGGFRGSFDQRPPGTFERPMGPGGFEQRPSGPSKFELRPPEPANFDRGSGNFERKPGQSRFDAGPAPGFEPHQNFDPRLGSQLPQGFKVEPGFEKIEGPRLDKANPANFITGPGVPGLAPTSSPSVIVPTPAINVEVLTKQKLALEEQIRQSEQNLAAQQQVLVTSQQTQIDDAIRAIQDTEMSQLATELNVDLNEFDVVLQPIIESCTKDAISGGKSWIFTHSSTQRHYHLLTSFLLKKTMDPAVTFNQRLHIIYLVNDVLHHCMRKGADDLQQALENMVIPMFCFSKVAEGGNEENVAKLDKLFSLWETKSNYVSPVAVDKLRNYNQTLIDFKKELMQRHALVVAQVANSIQQTFDGYQNQHKLFCQHVSQNIKTLEQQIQQGILQDQIRAQQQQQQQAAQMLTPMTIGLTPGVQVPGTGNLPPPSGLASFGPGMTGYPGGQGQNLTTQIIAPPYIPPVSEVGMFDLSKPPPGFPTPPPDKDLIPALPYYELPAGLMVQLVKLEDDSYKAVDPKAIRLPPPCPPSDRLIQAVEAFYAQPSHERPRDSEGWERLGLYEYFKAKNLARKQKEDDIREGRRDKSRSPSPIRRDSSPSGGRSPPRRRYQSKSPTPSRSSRRRSRSRSPSSSKSSKRKSSRRSRSRSRSPRRSPTPPSFSAPGLGMDRKLDESNKGHQLLKKMGWAGTGLGINEQGIEAPISGGEVRERKDQYKGVGISVNDPFESYRKSKGQAFVERMRARAEERL